VATTFELATPPLSGDAHIDALLASYLSWDHAARSVDGVIQYSFTLTPDVQGSFSNVQAFNADEQTATRLALAEISASTGIEFREVADGNAAQLNFANADFGFNGLFFPQDRSEFDPASGDLTRYDAAGAVYLHNNLSGGFADPYGSRAYEILLHEIGHAMGLRHPHDGPTMVLPWEDTNARSVMSYMTLYPAKSGYQEYDVAALGWLYGGDGLGAGGAVTSGIPVQLGTGASERLAGGTGHDYLQGASGDDTLVGGAGNDFLWGTAGNDLMKGGAGDDSFVMYDDDDVLVDSGGTDTVYVNFSWTLAPGLENLRMVLPLTFTTPLSGTGNGQGNIITGNLGANVLRGLGGDDSLDGGGSPDTLRGGGGDDMLRSNQGGDELTGGSGSDTFSLTFNGDGVALIADFVGGSDRILLESAGWMTSLGRDGAFSAGDPRFHAAPGAASGHDADDRVIYNTSSAELYFDPDGSGANGAYLIARLQAGATLAASDIVVANSELVRAETLKGSAGDDVLAGGDGDDWLIGGEGADSLDGGAGNDVYVVTAGDVLSDAGGLDRVETAVSWTLGAAFEDLLVIGFAGIVGNGNALDNRMVGNAGADAFNGRAENDELLGLGGRDRLQGGAGHDMLLGGSGADRFLFGQANDDSADRIVDFGRGRDGLQLDDAGFSALGSRGRFVTDDARFYAAPGASGGHDASDRVIYDTASGNLYYDADGSGAGAAVLVATLDNHAALQARDVIVT
jgi:Ca2+-binding RTX toxin-like protein